MHETRTAFKCETTNRQAVYILIATLFCSVSPMRVSWELEQTIIEFGKPLSLKCSLIGMDHIPQDMSRQWTGEKNNRLLTFNGVSTCPSNYTEILQPPNAFKIYFNSTSELNLNCPYSCRVGTSFDEKLLKVNESNFVYMPTANTTTSYENYNTSYELILNIQKVYPRPTCYLTVGRSSLNFTATQEKQLGFLYNITYYYTSSKPLRYCGDYLSVHCIVSPLHNRFFNYKIRQFEQCGSTDEGQITVIIFVTISVLLLIMIIITVIYKRKMAEKNTQPYPSVNYYHVH